MSANSATETLAKKLEKIKSILKFRPEEKLNEVWDLALDKETSVGCWWYEIKDGKFEYSDKVRLHMAGVFNHIWKNLEKHQWIRGHIFRMENKNGLLVHVEDFPREDASGSILASMVRKVAEVTGYPINMFVDEMGRIWGKV